MDMDKFDAEMAARVWQRVRGQGAQPQAVPPQAVQPQAVQPQSQNTQTQPQAAPLQLPQLLLQVLEDAAAYQTLARRYSGGENGLLRRLAQEAQAQAACLRGVCALTGVTPPKAPPARREPLSAQALLRRCYDRELARFRVYAARESDGPFGPVFARLARQSQGHCAWVLEILGAY